MLSTMLKLEILFKDSVFFFESKPLEHADFSFKVMKGPVVCQCFH